RQILRMEEPVDRLADELLGRVAARALGRAAAIEHGEAVVEERDAVVAVLDERAEARFALQEGLAKPRALARIANRAQEARAIDLALDEVVLRASVHRVDRGAVVVARREHDDRDAFGRERRAVDGGQALAVG